MITLTPTRILMQISTDTSLTRRSLLALSGAAVVAATGPAFALTTPEAKVLVGRLVGEINGIIASNKSEAAMIRHFDGVLNRYADMPIIARSILGVPWRGASAAERRDFTRALQGYLARKYGKQFRRFSGGEIEVLSARPVRSFFEVRSMAQLPGEAPFEVVFLVSNGSGRDLFFNMIIEGINLRTTENTEINALLDRNGGSVARLTQALGQLG